MAKKKGKKKDSGKKDIKKKGKKKKLLKLKGKKKQEAKKQGIETKDKKKKKSQKKAPAKKLSKKNISRKKDQAVKKSVEKVRKTVPPEGSFSDLSSNYNVRNALTILRTLKSPEEVQAFTRNEKRLTISRAVPGVLRKLGG